MTDTVRTVEPEDAETQPQGVVPDEVTLEEIALREEQLCGCICSYGA